MSKPWRTLGAASLTIALLQSLCTAVFAISGIRVVIGLTALAAVSGVYSPARGFHQDAIRIPMLMFASAGALVNLAVVLWIRHLRARQSAQWRKRELSSAQRRSEIWQIALAILTLILVGLETWTHSRVHRTGKPPAASTVSWQDSARVRGAEFHVEAIMQSLTEAGRKLKGTAVCNQHHNVPG